MATLYKHGELGQLEKLDHKLAFCADGQVLINRGDGWKTWKKLKEGVDPREHFERKKSEYAAKLTQCPMFALWKEAVHSLVPFRLRHLVVQTIAHMPSDADGVYSELDDYGALFGDNARLGVEDCVQLCRLYQCAVQEAKGKL